MSALTNAVEELHANALTNNFNLMALKPPSKDFVREFEHEGLLYRTTLTRIVLRDKNIYVLSVCKLSAVPNEIGSLLPTEEEGGEIATAFFPGGFQQLPPEADVLKRSLKYLALL